eukprot:scaffold1345_cov173-Ochromonas_danica.AAC.7
MTVFTLTIIFLWSFFFLTVVAHAFRSSKWTVVRSSHPTTSCLSTNFMEVVLPTGVVLTACWLITQQVQIQLNQIQQEMRTLRSTLEENRAELKEIQHLLVKQDQRKDSFLTFHAEVDISFKDPRCPPSRYDR